MGRINLPIFLIVGFAGISSAAFAAEGEPANDGQIAFNNNCRTCHSTNAGDNRLGPNLNSIIGRKVGGAEGYVYSSAMGSSSFEWTAETLDQFIADPNSVVPGNNMKPYAGIGEKAVRGAIISHLKNQ